MLINASAVDWANTYTGPLFHALLCDPPYHLTSITERFGKPDLAPAQYGRDGAFARASKGFMGRDWDGGDIAFQPSTWAAFRRILYPGAFGMAFASTRGFHRMAVAIEDAGFIIHPVIMCWAFGSGFPKATRVDVQIDNQAYRDWLIANPAQAEQRRAIAQALQAAEESGDTDRADELEKVYTMFDKALRRAAGVEPIVIGTKKHQPKFAAADFGYREKDNGFNSKDRESFELTSGATPESQAWGGHRYGMQVLKPALEPIIVFQKPYEGRPIDCITSTGAGAINIDAGRIATEDDLSFGSRAIGTTAGIYGYQEPKGEGSQHELGRWPANLILSHHPECEQVGTRRVKGTKGEADYSPGTPATIAAGCAGGTIKTGRHHADADGYETIADWQCVEACPVRRLGEQSGESGGGMFAQSGQRSMRDNLVYGKPNTTRNALDNWGDSGTASRYFYNADWMLDRLEQTDPLIYEAKASTTEREAGLEGFPSIVVDDGRDKPIDNAYLRGETQRRNIHPTIKPIALARHLATLLLPPEKYGPRRLFVPFAGVASEMIGAMLAGWEDVTGVELEADHMPVAQARIDYWQQMKYKLTNPDAPIKVTINRKAPNGQLSLFTEDET
jgi:hypothetical protein